MASIVATPSTATPILSAPDKSRVTQARRDAEQAQSRADDLRSQADNADRTARESQDRADELRARSQQVDATYESQLRGKAAQNTGRLINVSA